jgi:hypothetical protein
VSRGVVITGVGALTPAGRGVDVLADSVRSGTCSLAIDPELEALGLRCRRSGRLRGVDAAFAELPLDGISPDFFSRHSRIGAIAAHDALVSANGAAIGRVLVASAAGPMGELELCFRVTRRQDDRVRVRVCHRSPARGVRARCERNRRCRSRRRSG